MTLTASILIIYVNGQGTNVKLPDDVIELSKHVAVYIIQRDTVVILFVHLLVVIKNKIKYFVELG